MLRGPAGRLRAALWVARVVDALVGEPTWLYRRLPHPVVALGALITWLEARLLDPGTPRPAQRRAGVLLLLLVAAVAAGAGLALTALLRPLPAGWIIEGALMSACLAQRSLLDHVRAVAQGLRASLADGRRAVARIVGRDPERLDAPGVARAAIESLAENLSDGVVAPLFWGVVAGLPGMLV